MTVQSEYIGGLEKLFKLQVIRTNGYQLAMNKLRIEIKSHLYYQNCYGSFLMDGNMFNYC